MRVAGLPSQWGKLTVDHDKFCVWMVNNIGYLAGGETDIYTDQNCSNKGYSIVCLEHGWDIGTDKSHFIIFSNTVLLQGTCKTINPLRKFAIIITLFSVDYSSLVRIDKTASGQEFNWSQDTFIYIGWLYRFSPFRQVIVAATERSVVIIVFPPS